MKSEQILKGLRDRDQRGIARAISLVEDNDPLADEILSSLDDSLVDQAMVLGVTGPPGAGKSTLLSVVSAAHPKIADYPFTTRTPVLGIVRLGEAKSCVMVDIPGLIEGAHAGRGMGKDFLRHIERCRLLLYLVDVTHPDPEGGYRMLRSELMRYDDVLLERPSVLVLTKCDLLERGVAGVPPELRGIHDRSVAISAVTREGLDQLLAVIRDALR